MEKLFKQLEFKETHFVQGRYSIADLFNPKERCGIYILHFENKQFYVGLAIDIVRRYTQHRKNHSDIAHISFKNIKKEQLEKEEKHVVQYLQSEGLSLRNIQLVSIIEGETDFDLLMSVEQQEIFISNLTFNSFEGDKFEIEEQRIKYERNFKNLYKLPYFDSVIKALKIYTRIGIPFPKITEYSFWCITAPGNSSKFSRININWQEVCTFIFLKNGFEITFHLAKSPLIEAFGRNLDKLFDQFQDLELMVDENNASHTYAPGGQDQIAFVISSTNFFDFIEIEAVQKAIRLFNLRLMRKGATIYNRYHSFDLSRVIFED